MSVGVPLLQAMVASIDYCSSIARYHFLSSMNYIKGYCRGVQNLCICLNYAVSIENFRRGYIICSAQKLREFGKFSEKGLLDGILKMVWYTELSVGFDQAIRFGLCFVDMYTIFQNRHCRLGSYFVLYPTYMFFV